MNDKNILEVITGSEKCFFGTDNKFIKKYILNFLLGKNFVQKNLY